MQWESFVWTSYPIPPSIIAGVSMEQSLIKKQTNKPTQILESDVIYKEKHKKWLK